jgi:hypothetical protein
MSTPAPAGRARPVEEAREHLARCALAWLLAERDSANLACPYTLPEASEALDLAARDLTEAVYRQPYLRKERGR